MSEKALRLAIQISPEKFEYYVPFLTSPEDVLARPGLDLFYRYDASNLGLVEIDRRANTAEFFVPSTEGVIELNDELRKSLKDLGPGMFIYDFERREPIWVVLECYPCDYEDWRYTPLRDSIYQTALICSYTGHTVKVDPHGFLPALAYFRSKIFNLSSGPPSHYGVMLLSKLILGEIGVVLPEELVLHNLPFFTPSVADSSSTLFLKGKQLQETISIMSLQEIEDLNPEFEKTLFGEEQDPIEAEFQSLADDEEEELFDGTRCLSAIVKLPPSKWTNNPQERLKIKQDIPVSAKLTKIICRGTSLIFHTDDLSLTIFSLMKELGIPSEYSANIMVYVDNKKEGSHVLL